MTLRMSWMKPMSSIRSASSRTNVSTDRSGTSPCDIRSRSRPGVATRMSIPRRRACDCGPWLTPPKTMACRRSVCRPYAPKLSAIWEASSRVGVSTRTRMGRRPVPLQGVPWRRCRIGSAKAAVFPVPVCAQPIRSFPASTMGIAFSWMGVGTVYFFSATARRISGRSPNSSNDIFFSNSCSVCIFSLLLTFFHQAQPVGGTVCPSDLPHGEVSGEAG